MALLILFLIGFSQQTFAEVTEPLGDSSWQDSDGNGHPLESFNQYQLQSCQAFAGQPLSPGASALDANETRAAFYVEAKADTVKLMQ